MPSVLHSADLHLRDRQYNTSSRAADFRSAFEQVLDIGIREKVAAILLAGDLLDNNRPSSETIEFLFQMDRKLVAANMPCFVCNGDHDKTDPPWLSLMGGIPDGGRGGFRVLENERATIPGTDLTVYGLDFIGKTKDRFLELKDSLPASDILLWHTMVKEFAGFMEINGEGAVSLAEIPFEKFSFIALGDLHARKYLRNDATGCWIGYPGPTEICKGDEKAQKSVTIVDFDDAHKVTDLREIPLKTRTAFFYRLNRSEEVDAAVAEAAKVRDENPIIIARYNRNLPGVISRFYEALDPDKAIMRLTAMAEDEGTSPGQTLIEEERTVESFLPEWFRPGSEIHTMSEACCRPDAPVNDLLNAYVDSYMAKEAAGA